MSYLVFALSTNPHAHRGQADSESSGPVSAKPQCKKDEKWPLTLGLRKWETRENGGDCGELGSNCQLPQSQPAASCLNTDLFCPHVQIF